MKKNESPSLRRELKGVVVSARMDKTVSVRVVRSLVHPLFGKVVSRSSKYYAHCVGFDVKEGEKVRIVETRPISKLKRWRVVGVLS